VPPAGQEVLVRGLPAPPPPSGATRTVKDEDVTALCTPRLPAELARVARALGGEFAGIDIIANDLG
jgi:hypothetical protein